MSRPRSSEAGVESRPVLALRDEDRDAVAEAIADMLVAAFDRGHDAGELVIEERER